MEYKLVFLSIAIVCICFVGFFDFKYRYVKHDFWYLIILACSAAIGGIWPEKVICLFAFPILLFVVSFIMEKVMKRGPIPVGGADIKLMTAMVFLFGFAQFALIFVVAATMGIVHVLVKKEIQIPLCGYLAIATLLYGAAMWVCAL